jgi:hypothetical protein
MVLVRRAHGSRVKSRAGWILHAAGDVLHEATTFGWAHSLGRERAEAERLLPYIVPVLNRWRRSLLREGDWTDLAELIEGVG